MSSCAAIVFSNLNYNTLSTLTTDRTVAAIPFACRYRLVDFALSNMVNADISNINVVVNYNYRSLVEHINSGKDWDLARRSGGITCISPYQTASTSEVKMYSTHMEALRNIEQYINGMKEDYVVLADSTCLMNIDLSAAIEAHADSAAEMTFVTAPCKPGFTVKHPRLFFKVEEDGVISDAVISDRPTENCPEFNTQIVIMSCDFLRSVLNEADAHNYHSLTYDLILNKAQSRCYRAYRHDGYYACISSFEDYYRASIELTADCSAYASLLGRSDRPVYTKVHNSAPVVYEEGASVKDCLIADNCVIEGTVENSILFRGVKVGRGSVVKNSILFGGTVVGDNASVNCVVADKQVVISDHCQLSGHETLPFYIAKGRHV